MAIEEDETSFSEANYAFVTMENSDEDRQQITVEISLEEKQDVVEEGEQNEPESERRDEVGEDEVEKEQDNLEDEAKEDEYNDEAEELPAGFRTAVLAEKEEEEER